MPETMTNQDLNNVDISKIAALQQKRSLAFVNHFIITSAQFLNSFMKNCELKLINFERKLEKVNASLVLLEAKLSSIPEANLVSEDLDDSRKENIPDNNSNETGTESTESKDSSHNTITEESPDMNREYDRFVKMVQVGVPLQAVKLKVSLEGLDPDVLEKIISKTLLLNPVPLFETLYIETCLLSPGGDGCQCEY